MWFMPFLKRITAKNLDKAAGSDLGYSKIDKYFEEFKGMEVINKDWYKCLKIQKKFMENCGEFRWRGIL